MQDMEYEDRAHLERLVEPTKLPASGNERNM